MSTELRMFSAEQVRDVARQLVAAEPLLHSLPAERLAERCGWRVCDAETYDFMIQADLGLGVAECLLYISRADAGGVDSISAALCDNARRPIPPEAAAVIRDTFAIASRVLIELFGPPAGREPGALPELRWRRPAATLVLTQSTTTTRLAVYNTVDYDDKLEKAANEHE